MTALAADRDTPRRDGEDFEFPCAASKTFYVGAIVVLDTSGNAEPATAATGKIGAGVCQEALVSTSAAAEKVKVKSGCFRFVNGESITKAHIGDAAYANDDQTIYRTATGRSQVGTIVDVDSEGVWVMIAAPLAVATAGLLAANNLSDVGTLSTAQSNLGLTDGTINARFESLVVDDVSTLTEGAKFDANAAAPVRKVDVVTVTATQLRTLAASPKELVAAAAGKVHVFRGALISYRGGSNAFDSVGAGEDLAVRYENGSGAIVSASLDTTTDINFGATTDADATLPALATVVVTPANKALVLDNVGGGELAAADDDANGDGIVTVTITYDTYTVVA